MQMEGRNIDFAYLWWSLAGGRVSLVLHGLVGVVQDLGDPLLGVGVGGHAPHVAGGRAVRVEGEGAGRAIAS